MQEHSETVQGGELDWSPSGTESPRYAEFARYASKIAGRDLTGSYADLWRWSVDELETFWGAVWDFFGLPERAEGSPVLADATMPGAVWFPDQTLNYAERVLHGRDPDAVAIVSIDESLETESFTWGELRQQVASFAASLRARGVGPGDRVCGYLPNRREAIIALLGTAAVGATWAVCGLDYPASAAASRIGQLDPRVLVTTTAQTIGGQAKDRRDDVVGLIAEVPSLEHVVLLDGAQIPVPEGVERWAWDDWAAEPAELETLPVAFDHPLWVVFSSGTTGKPKGIVHGHGGVVLEYLKFGGLHWDFTPEDRLFWFTTPSWMMWNYLASNLLSGVSVVCYDGSPAFPTPDQVFRVARVARATVAGMSPAYVEGLRSRAVEVRPHDELRAIGITGSVFGPETHRWLRSQVGDRVLISSSSGGTDIVSGFAGSTPALPTWLGELSSPFLGVALDAFDADGDPVRGEVGELVVTKPMPSMPVRFWNDERHERYTESYFDEYPGVWRHGDWITITDRGSITFHGRSDATLNRFGVRMGTGDIYGPVESLPEIDEALVLGVEQPDGGYWMPLFVKLAEGAVLDDELRDRIRAAIRTGASPRHVPDEVIEAPGVPHTRTGKKLEVPLKKLFRGADPAKIADADAIDDPGVLAWYADLARTRQEG